eukprot:355789-Chlamydomonas_euryale.AAC.3
MDSCRAVNAASTRKRGQCPVSIPADCRDCAVRIGPAQVLRPAEAAGVAPSVGPPLVKNRSWLSAVSTALAEKGRR